MIEFQFEPPVKISSATEAFAQTVRMVDGSQTIGTARWHSPGDANEGLLQILDLTITPNFRRHKYGSGLLTTVIDQARQLQVARKGKLRRAYFGLAQKTEVVGRAFLTYHGFQHVGTMNGLFRDQDLMFYVKSMD